MYGRVVGSTTELRSFVREAVSDVYRYTLALTVSTTKAEQLTTSAAVRLARHVDAVGAAPVSTARLNLAVRREVLNTVPHHRRHRRSRDPGQLAPVESVVRGSVALSALAALPVEQRIALVLRHHDGLLLPDIAAALHRSYAEAEHTLAQARAGVADAIERLEDGSGTDQFARLVRAVPGPPDSLADKVWVTVDAALVPDYAGDDAWRAPEDDPIEGFVGRPVEEEHTPPVKEARRVGTTLVVGASALGLVLGVAALTAPHDTGVTADASSTAAALSTTAASFGDLVPTSAAVGTSPSPLTSVVPRSSRTPAVPDLEIDPKSVPPHVPDHQEPFDSSTPLVAAVPALVDVNTTVRYRDGKSSVIVRRVDLDGTSEVWLVSVDGRVQPRDVTQTDLLQDWAVSGGVVLALRVAADPDRRILVGLRSGGAATWLRLPDDAEPVAARPDSSVLCIVHTDAGDVLTTYQVLR